MSDTHKVALPVLAFEPYQILREMSDSFAGKCSAKEDVSVCCCAGVSAFSCLLWLKMSGETEPK